MNIIKKISVLVLLFGLIFSNYLIFFYAPTEKVMGAVQKIFYWHVSSAIACYLSFAIVFISGVYYLANKGQKSFYLLKSAGEVGFVFCTIVLATGMIWGKAAWGTWFNWEPRLVTFLLLWLVFLSFNILKYFGDNENLGNHLSILGIVGAITVPIMVFSIKLLPQIAQLHPEVIELSLIHI